MKAKENCNSIEKDLMRCLIPKYLASVLPADSYTYFGFETEEFQSLRFIDRNLEVNFKGSMVMERQAGTVRAMRKVQKKAGYSKNKFLKSIKKLSIVKGELEKNIDKMGQGYNVLNLDYCGHLSTGKEKVLKAIITSPDILQDQAIIFMTVSIDGLNISRQRSNGYLINTEKACEYIADKLSNPIQKLSLIGFHIYTGKVNIKRKMAMAVFQFQRLFKPINPEYSIDIDFSLELPEVKVSKGKQTRVGYTRNLSSVKKEWSAIKKLIAGKYINQVVWAKKAKVSQATISNIKTGRWQPGPATIMKLYKASKRLHS